MLILEILEKSLDSSEHYGGTGWKDPEKILELSLNFVDGISW